MISWDLRVTRGAVEQLFGTAQLRLLDPCLETVRDRQTYARYHYQEACKALAEGLPPELSFQEVLERTSPWKSKEQQELDDCLTRVSANFLACAQNMHALLDNLSHVIYFALGWNLHPKLKLPERDVSLYKIKSTIDLNTDAARVAKLLNQASSEAPYLAALINHCKHRSLVPFILRIDAPQGDEPPYMLECSAFTYDKTPYAARPFAEVLEIEYRKRSTWVVDVGRALNSTLEARLCQRG